MNLKKLTLEAKAKAISALAERGITDTFTVRVKKLPNLTAAEHWLGLYRGKSQFRGNRPIFWINEALPRLVEGTDVPVEDVLLDTLLHEYGHVIFEYAREMAKGKHRRACKALWSDIKAQQIGPDDEFEEEFAEMMGQTLGSGHINEVYAEFAERFGKLLAQPEPNES